MEVKKPTRSRAHEGAFEKEASNLDAFRVEGAFWLGLFASEGALHLGDGGVLQLADALAADSKVTSNFFEGERLFAIQAETLVDDG